MQGCWQEAISATHSASHTPVFAPFQLEMGSHSLQTPLKGKGIRHTSRWSINKILEKSLNACGFISFKKVSPLAGGLLSSLPRTCSSKRDAERAASPEPLTQTNAKH